MTPIEQIRLNTGDVDQEDYYLEDTTLDFLLSESGNDILDASIAALEAIINRIALMPSRWEIGDASETRASIEQLEGRLQDLKNKRNARKYTAIPIVFNTDRKNWDDLNIWGEDY